MLSIKNASEVQKVWGGVIFDPDETKIISSTDKVGFSNDSVFYTDLLAQQAKIYADDNLVTDPIMACEIIRYEFRKDSEGNVISRTKQVPDSWHRQQKYIQYTTATADSLVEKKFVNIDGHECSLQFHKLDENNAMVSCTAVEATVTSLLWTHPWQTMPNYAEIRLASIDDNITGFIGNNGIEAYPGGMIAYGISFAMVPTYTFSVLEPRVLDYNLIVRLQHPAGYQKKVEIFFEFFTTFQSI